MSLHSKPVYLLVLAQRVELSTPFRITPQQSDYVAVWEGRSDGAEEAAAREVLPRSLKRRVLETIPVPIRELAKTVLGHRRRRRRFNPLFFKKTTLAQLRGAEGRESLGSSGPG